MSHTRTTASRRTRLGRIVAVTAVATLATAGSLLAITTSASAAATSRITAVSPHLATALTANTVITVTGTGFDEALITGVTIAGCTTAPTYIVASPTMLILKTALDASSPPAPDCVASATLRAITITEVGGTTLSVPATAAQALTFVAPPTIATPSATVRPVTTNNTAGAGATLFAVQTAAGVSASTKGGTVIKVLKGATAFTNTSPLLLSASLDGVALTGIYMPVGGAYFTGVVGAHAADLAPVLKITSSGVSKSFTYALNSATTAGTHDFQYVGSTINVSPAFGPSNGFNKIVITGAGFSTATPASAAAAADGVTVDGQACVVLSSLPAPTATSITCTVPAATNTPFEGPVEVVVTVGSTVSTVSAGSTYTYVAK